MGDKFGVMWTRFGGNPRKLAGFVLTSDQFRMTYDRDATDLPGASCLLDPSMMGVEPYVHKSNEILGVPAFAWAKIPPPADARGMPNLQRRIYLRTLLAMGRHPAPGLDTDFEILLLSGRDGIGHVDYFPDDGAAETFYGEMRRARFRKRVLGKDSDLWAGIAEALSENSGADPDRVLDVIQSRIGSSPSINGMIPKVVLSIPDRETWDGTASASGALAVEKEAFVDVIVKIETEEYKGLMDLENLCFDIHRRAGIETPRTWIRTTEDGRRLLAIERFDRVGGHPVPMESMFSVLSIASGEKRDVRTPTDGSYQRVGKALGSLNPMVSVRPALDSRELVQRIVYASLTGNGDMHLENIAVLGSSKDRRLSPVYDPAPMRAFARHNLISALKLTDESQRHLGMPADIAEKMAELADLCGVDGDEFREILGQALEVTESYSDEVAGLDIPAGVKKCLDTATSAMRYRLGKFANSAISRNTMG